MYNVPAYLSINLIFTVAVGIKSPTLDLGTDLRCFIELKACCSIQYCSDITFFTTVVTHSIVNTIFTRFLCEKKFKCTSELYTVMHSTLNIILIALLCCGKKSSQTVVCYAQLHSSFLHAQQSSRSFSEILGIISAARSGSASFCWVRNCPRLDPDATPFFQNGLCKKFFGKN